MTPGDQGGRPSVPHAMTRVRTDRRAAVPPEEAETVRESVDPAMAELLAIVRDPSGLSTESVLKLLLIGQRHATAATRQQDALGVGLGVGQMREEFQSIQGTLLGKRRRREMAYLIGFVAAGIFAGAQWVWNTVAPEARAAAEVAVIAPAIEAKRVATVAVETTDDHEARITAMENTQKDILAAIEKLNGAVVMVVDRLPEPEPRTIEVPASTLKRRLK